MMRRLKPHQQKLLELTYRRIVGVCRDRGITPIHLLVPDPRARSTASEESGRVDRLTLLAEEVGFLTLNLKGVFEKRSSPELWVSRSNRHPNDLGHRLIADRLYGELLAHESTLGLELSSPR
jgi:hypothetical protein